MQRKNSVCYRAIAMGGCLIPSLFLCARLRADTLILKNGEEMKGLVVERHADRVILSTEKGEVPVMLEDIRNIDYQDSAQHFFELGKAREAAGRLGEAIAYYEEALKANPEFDEAKKAALGVRNRYWATQTQGPSGEIERQQAIQDAWRRGGAM